jgi:hypothetical protein
MVLAIGSIHVIIYKLAWSAALEFISWNCSSFFQHAHMNSSQFSRHSSAYKSVFPCTLPPFDSFLISDHLTQVLPNNVLILTLQHQRHCATATIQWTFCHARHLPPFFFKFDEYIVQLTRNNQNYSFCPPKVICLTAIGCAIAHWYMWIVSHAVCTAYLLTRMNI